MADVPACLSFSDLSNSYPADFESEYGPNHPSRELVRTARRMVVKVLHMIYLTRQNVSFPEQRLTQIEPSFLEHGHDKLDGTVLGCFHYGFWSSPFALSNIIL